MKFTTSTYFIKGQLPGVTIDQLLALYKRELQDQQLSNSYIKHNSVVFSNNALLGILNGYPNKFSGFKEGEIKIVETDKEFVVYLDANVTVLTWLYANATFAVYFTSLRNDMERTLQG